MCPPPHDVRYLGLVEAFLAEYPFRGLEYLSLVSALRSSEGVDMALSSQPNYSQKNRIKFLKLKLQEG
jgi:hypothetical protein